MDSKEYFLDRLEKNKSRIIELEAQNAKFERYISTNKFPKKNGKKPIKNTEKEVKKEVNEEKGYFGF